MCGSGVQIPLSAPLYVSLGSMKYYIDYDTFIISADKFIERLVASVEKYDKAGVISIDIFDDKVLLSIDGQSSPYIVSKHGTYREIWFVSPLSGPDRFKLAEQRWINSSGVFLDQVLVSELSNFCEGIKISS